MSLERFYRERATMALAGINHRSHLHKMIADGLFPAPVKIGKRAVAWRESEIAAWQAARIADRDASKN